MKSPHPEEQCCQAPTLKFFICCGGNDVNVLGSLKSRGRSGIRKSCHSPNHAERPEEPQKTGQSWEGLLRAAPSPASARSADGSRADSAAAGAGPEASGDSESGRPCRLSAPALPWLPKAAPSSSRRRTCSCRILAATSRPSPPHSSSGTPSSCPPSPSGYIGEYGTWILFSLLFCIA